MYKFRLAAGVALLAATTAMATPKVESDASVSPNPLLAEWTGPHGGIPPFDKVKVTDFKPALEAGMAHQRKEVEAIANDTAAPTFENTLVAMEQAGRMLNRVSSVYNIWSSNMSSPEYQKIEQEMAPKLAAFQDEINHNAKLFKRIEAVYNAPEKAKLTPEQQRLCWYYYTQFVQQGAKLDEAKKARMSELNQKLASLYTKFSQNQLADEENHAIIVDKVEDLAGMPQSAIDGAAAEAQRRKLKDKWVISNTRSSMEPLLTYGTNRSLREKAFRMWTSRGDNGDEHDNNKNVTEILKLRQERAQLLGYKTYAHWHLFDTMAKDPQKAMDLMMKVWKPAVEQVHTDVAAMQAIVDAEKGNFKLAPWDYRFYAEKVRKAKYDLDFNEVKPYLQLEHLREAMFWASGQLYGFKFVPVKDVVVYHPTMTVYEVQTHDGQRVGLWYFDPYARPGKNSGAWMNAYREQRKLDGPITTIVSNNANFIQGKPGDPVLIGWDDAETLFHEFGHALHGLNSSVTYPSLSGTNTPRDHVEFPSQLNEHWLDTPEVLKFLVDAKGKPLPPELVEKIKKAKTFNEGFKTTEFLASGILDMKLHLIEKETVDPKAFEKSALAELGMPAEIVMRHRIPAFGHIFSGEGYAAGYYGYLWAEVLCHDAWEAFTEAGSPYDPAVAKRLHDTIMSVGNTVDPAEAYRAFRGRDPKVDALLRERGFPVPTK